MKKYGSTLDMNTKVKLFNEWLENGGIETIWSIDLLEDLKKVRKDSNGNVIEETVSPLVNAAMLAYSGSQMTAPFFSEKHISEYNTTLQKSLFFDQENIDTEEQFDEIFEKYIDSNQILFRGVREAKWRLYSSLQRNWLTRKLFETDTEYPDLLEKIIENARNEQGGVLIKFLKQNRIDANNDIAVLSFLQHYGCPTPLLVS